MDVCAARNACGLAENQRQNIRKRVRKQREDDDARAKADAEAKMVRELATEELAPAPARKRSKSARPSHLWRRTMHQVDLEVQAAHTLKRAHVEAVKTGTQQLADARRACLSQKGGGAEQIAAALNAKLPSGAKR